MASLYTEIIIRATGCSVHQAEEIETVMRDVIFHSTLDWQTREQLEDAARTAHVVIQSMDGTSDPDFVSRRGQAARRRTLVEGTFRLSRSQYAALGVRFWTIADSVPGLTRSRLEWFPGAGYYLTFSGSKRAVTQAARMAEIPESEIRQSLRECDGSTPI
jgi:hypothetical protein